MGRWNTLVSVLPIKYSVELVVPLEEEPEPLEEEPELLVPEPEPEVSVPPPGKVRVAPLVENTTLPFVSVLYTVTPADESLPRASEVGCPYVLLPTQITPYSAPVALRKAVVLEYLLPWCPTLSTSQLKSFPELTS